MKKIFLLTKPRSLYRTVLFKLQALLFRKIIKSENAWKLFNEAGIAGFGVNLIRLYFPIYYDKKTARESFSPEVKAQFTKLMNPGCERAELNNAVLAVIPDLLKLPVEEIDPKGPYLDNYFFGIYDAAVLSAVMELHRPSKIVEIGSGISTRYMKLFRDRHALPTKIICIDPYPRAEIEGVADVIIREPLENVTDSTLLDLQRGDIVFLDGSHYVYQGNDTLTFFFKFLPALPPGVIVHIHDIFLPYDYAEEVASQLWSEQYIVAAMLLGGFKGYEIFYPAYYLSQNDEAIREQLNATDKHLKTMPFKLRKDHTAGYSFWIKKV